MYQSPPFSIFTGNQTKPNLITSVKLKKIYKKSLSNVGSIHSYPSIGNRKIPVQNQRKEQSDKPCVPSTFHNL